VLSGPQHWRAYKPSYAYSHYLKIIMLGSVTVISLLVLQDDDAEVLFAKNTDTETFAR